MFFDSLFSITILYSVLLFIIGFLSYWLYFPAPMKVYHGSMGGMRGGGPRHDMTNIPRQPLFPDARHIPVGSSVAGTEIDQLTLVSRWHAAGTRQRNHHEKSNVDSRISSPIMHTRCPPGMCISNPSRIYFFNFNFYYGLPLYTP